MKKEDLFKAIGDVNDAFLDENVTEIKHSSGWITAVLSLVACTALTAGLIHFVPKPARQPQEEIKVASSETTVTTVAETILQFSDNQNDIASAKAGCQVYISRMEDYAEVNKNAPESIFDTIPFPEVEIAVNAEEGYVSMLTVFDSNSLPRVGVLTRTDSDFTYLCQIDGLEFRLEHPDADTLIFHCENHPLDGRTLTLCRDAVQPFADLSDDDIQEAVIWTAFEENQAQGFIGRKLSDFADILKNMKLYYKTLAHESGDYYFTVTMKDGTSYEIQPTQGFIAIDGRLYYTDEATRQALAEFYQNYLTENVPETEVSNSGYKLYMAYLVSDIVTEPSAETKVSKNPLETMLSPYIEIGIDEEKGYVSMITAQDSDTQPHVGVCTRTDDGYECQINGQEFFLQDVSGYFLIFRSETFPSYNGVSYNGVVLEPQTLNDGCYPFKNIKDNETEEVFIDTPQQSIPLDSEAVSEFAGILRNINIYCKSLAHETGDYHFSVRMKDAMLYDIQPTQSFLCIDGQTYYADEASRKALAEFYQKYLPESVPETTTVPETSQTDSQSIVTVPSGNMGYVNLPYTTTEGETQPDPQVLPYTKLQTETTTTITEAVTELPAEISEVPEEIQNIMYEDDTSGIIFSRIQPENETHIEIAVENGCYLESNLSNAIRYYPEKKYAVSIQAFSHLLLQDIEEELAGKGIQILGHRESDGRILAIMTEEQLNQLNQTETMGFLIDLTSQQN